MKLHSSAAPANDGRAPDPLAGLVPRILAGDRAATNSLIVAVSGGMLRTVRKVIGSQHPDVEDVTQDAVVGLLQSLPNFRGHCGLAHFANQVALRRALHARRHFAARDRAVDFASDIDDADEPMAPHDELLLARERRRIVRGVLGNLSEVIAEAVALHFMFGHTVAQIAEMLEISPNTVWSRLKLGKLAIKKALESDARLRELMHGMGGTNGM